MGDDGRLEPGNRRQSAPRSLGEEGRAIAPRVTVSALAWTDPELGSIATPAGPMRIRAGFGSGLARRAGDPADIVWAVCDRGPNLSVDTAVERYGLTELAGLGDGAGAKIMPRTDLGPTLAKLRVHADRVELLATIRLSDPAGRPVPGIPMAGGAHASCEPAFDLAGAPLAPEPGGLDSEGVAACADGGFWIGDEYGPSLLRLDGEGKVLRRLVPAGLHVAPNALAYSVEPVLPALAGRRQINRGFEALVLSADERWLHLAFQSPLAHPDVAAHKQGRHVRLWQVDTGSGEVARQYVYPLDPPERFRRDGAKGEFTRSDIKLGEMAGAGDDALLLLERGSETSKIYRVTLDPALATPAEHLELATRPTLEELSARADFPLPVLAKELLFDSDDHPQVSADLEGMVLLSPTELLLINDNDFGLEGAETRFWRLRFQQPVA